jgi:ferrous iron transport protein A
MTPKKGARKGFSIRDMRGVHRRRKHHWSPFRLHREAQDGPSLSSVRCGEAVEIRQMDGGHQFLSRLASLGFTPGAHLEVIQNYGHGPIIVRLRDTRVALGRGEAKKILVRRSTEAEDGR